MPTSPSSSSFPSPPRIPLAESHDKRSSRATQALVSVTLGWWKGDRAGRSTLKHGGGARTTLGRRPSPLFPICHRSVLAPSPPVPTPAPSVCPWAVHQVRPVLQVCKVMFLALQCPEVSFIMPCTRLATASLEGQGRGVLAISTLVTYTFLPALPHLVVYLPYAPPLPVFPGSFQPDRQSAAVRAAISLVLASGTGHV